MITPFLSPELSNVSGIRHGFFSRHGGVSEGYFASLNCKSTSTDAPENVIQNRQCIVQHLGGRHWVGLHQKHTARAVFCHDPWEKGPEADAIVTTAPGLVLSIITADCVPILLCDQQKSIIAAIHAGWRGTFDGIIANTLNLMKEKGATDVVAAIGPCIQQVSYEVGPEFYGYFMEHNSLPKIAQFEDFFVPSPSKQGHFLFDLPKLVYFLLRQSAVGVIDTLPYNTFAEEEHFFSYRRKTLRLEPDMGCQASCIVLE